MGTELQVEIDGKFYRKCRNCDNPMQIAEVEMCAPCCFGEAAAFQEYDFIPAWERERAERPPEPEEISRREHEEAQLHWRHRE